MKIPKTQTRKQLVKACDTELSLSVREEHPACVICGSTKNLTCGHLFSRVAFSTRWERLNVATQCAGCNLRHEYDPHKFTLWFIKLHGLEAYERLAYKHSHVSKLSDAQLRLILMEIKERRRLWEGTQT